MTKKRRVFGDSFKSKEVLDALKERETIEVLAKKYELLPTQISMWKSDAIKNISLLFSTKKPVAPKELISTEKLYAEIGQLKMENDYLKKKLL